MQTDRPEDRASARLKQLRQLRLIRQNGNRNGMVNSAGTQFNSLPFSQVSNVPEHPSMKEAFCDLSTMRMETVTQRTLLGEAANVPFLATLRTSVRAGG